MKPFVSMLLAATVIALMFAIAPAQAGTSWDMPTNGGCAVAQGPDEWLPGTVTTTLPTSGDAGTARVLDRRKTIAMKLPSGAAGTCYVTIFDPATLDSTGKRGFDIAPGDGWTTVDIGPGDTDHPTTVVCTAQLVTPKGLKVFQCK